ncbi:peroxisomal N(1)-acetyl-spermine/spermidine oxidase-like isoform X2 [Macrobrachium nipponense]|uniref:peroxisomal N(1)-acetyl-spermine/spermidine oxidase-like isoform X2 n=1 Tax=Macrobrachium nipponense TaxID=159736 RepID=UPI0030C7F081
MNPSSHQANTVKNSNSNNRRLNSGSILTEDGAEWIHGGKGNFLYFLAQKLGGLTQPLPDNVYDVRFRMPEGKAASKKGYLAARRVFNQCENNKILKPYEDKGYGECYIDRFPAAYKSFRAPKTEKAAWLEFLHLWVNKDTGMVDWRDQSGRDARHFTDFGYDEWNQWKAGYDTLTNYIQESIPAKKIELNSPVCKIFWDSDPQGGVLVVTSAQTAYIADYVLVTASVGHLKERQDLLFSPQLPASYKSNLDGIELGIADKVQLGWDTKWWGNDPIDLSPVFINRNLTEEMSWLYGIMEFMNIHQQDKMIQGFVPGDYALQMEKLPEETVKSHLIQFLKGLTGQEVPEPTFFRRSKWMDNVWMRGSYNSYVTVEGDKAGLKSRKPFLKSIKNQQNNKVIFWAGEHTDTTRFGTVDGAMKSGTKAAQRIVKYRKMK